MNILIVNSSPPEVRHVSGKRAASFANELVLLGHRVFLLCPDASHGHGAFMIDPPGPSKVADALAVVRLKSGGMLRQASFWRLALVRSASLRMSYLTHGCLDPHFVEDGLVWARQLPKNLRPDICWGIFGNSSCWTLAMEVARMWGCPWVADMKDSFDVFIPRGIRALVARRFHSMSGATANAQWNADCFRRRFGVNAAVVYSGVDDSFLTSGPSVRSDDEYITLVGSIYSESRLMEFVNAWGDRFSCQPGRPLPPIVYIGADADKVKRLAVSNGLACFREIRDYERSESLSALCANAVCNCYISSDQAFHHKLLELISLGKPVLAFGERGGEADDLAGQFGARFFKPQSASDVHLCIKSLQVSCSDSGPVSRVDPSRLSWGHRAMGLEAFFQSVIGVS